VSDNQGINFAGWMIGLVVLAGVAIPVLVVVLCCFGGALAGVFGANPSATP
jgi:hypothetical protein